MESYYDPEDLPRFEEIGKEAPELAQKFFEYYNAVFAEGELTEREKALIGRRRINRKGKGSHRFSGGPCHPMPLLH
jgi:hypothetical protein